MTNQRGFTLIELMTVVAILGVLSSIAIPRYLDYIAQGKITALMTNHEVAASLVRNEISKRNAGEINYLDTADEFTAELNVGGKKSVYDPSRDAFTTSGVAAGTIVLTKNIAVVPNTYTVVAYDKNSFPVAGTDLVIVLE